MEETKRKLTIDNIIRYLLIFMILFMSYIMVISIINKEFDGTSILAGFVFIIFLICLKWIIKEAGME